MKHLLTILALLAFAGVATDATAQVTFSPAPGTYSGTQTVSISCNPSSNTTIWYTTNGYPAGTARNKYTGPIQVSATTTINAICATTTASDIETGVQDSGTGWKCNVPPNTPPGNCPGPVNSSSNNGTSGSLSAYGFTPGAPGYMTASTTATGGTNALLIIHTPSTTCDSCTSIAEHINFKPTGGPTVITRNELDMEQCCDSSGTNPTYALHQASLQCNATAGVWDINASGKWEHTTIACNLPANVTADVVYEAEWVNGDNGCGGLGCMYLDALTVNGTRYFPLAQYCNTSDGSTTQNPSCAQQEMVSHSTWGHFGAGNQHQIGLNGTTPCGASPCTGGRYIYTNNVTTAEGTVGTASATYTISGTTVPAPVITLPTDTYVMPTSTTITDALSGAGISWCYVATGTCTPNTSYSGSIYVDPASTETICANAHATGYSTSSTVCAYYVTASAATPPVNFSLGGGTYLMPTSTSISDSAPGAAILWCYVASGTCTPTTMYTSKIYIDPATSETICSTAWAPGEGQSTPVCNTYKNQN